MIVDLIIINIITSQTIDKVHECRQSLIDIPKSKLTGMVIVRWLEEWKYVFDRADSIANKHLWIYIGKPVSGFENETDSEACLEIRSKIVETLDETIVALDSNQVIKPVLDQLILKVKDDKLVTLLKEFNACRVEQPNIAAMGFRTILSLIIIERAKIVIPSGDLAQRDDIRPERDIKAAIDAKTLFSNQENRKLARFLNGGDKDSFDFVVHKPNYLIHKEELEDAVELLNRLLPTII